VVKNSGVSTYRWTPQGQKLGYPDTVVTNVLTPMHLGYTGAWKTANTPLQYSSVASGGAYRLICCIHEGTTTSCNLFSWRDCAPPDSYRTSAVDLAEGNNGKDERRTTKIVLRRGCAKQGSIEAAFRP